MHAGSAQRAAGRSVDQQGSNGRSNTEQPPQPGPSSTNNMPQQKASPTSRLTQTSLELSPDNQVKLVTTKQAGRQRANHRQTSSKKPRNTKRKRRSPLVQAGGGKRTKAMRGATELVSPSIRDYFKTSCGDGSKARGKRNVQISNSFHSICTYS